MSQKLVQVNFKFSVSKAEYEQANPPEVAAAVADSPGLAWKIWLMNAQNQEAGGILLFDDEASVQAFLDGPIVDSVKSSPALSDIRVKVFDVMEEQTHITRGPVRESLRV